MGLHLLYLGAINSSSGGGSVLYNQPLVDGAVAAFCVVRKPVMTGTDTLFAALRQAADPQVVDRIEHLITQGLERDLNRINVLDFAVTNDLDEEQTLAAFVRAARTGMFDLCWNVLCPGCGGVLES